MMLLFHTACVASIKQYNILNYFTLDLPVSLVNGVITNADASQFFLDDLMDDQSL